MTGLTLEQLFEEAKKFGRVIVIQTDDGWNADIKFRTVDGVTLKAESGCRHDTPAEALTNAIEQAILIVETMKKSTLQDTAEIQDKLGIKHKILTALGVNK